MTLNHHACLSASPCQKTSGRDDSGDCLGPSLRENRAHQDMDTSYRCDSTDAILCRIGSKHSSGSCGRQNMSHT